MEVKPAPGKGMGAFALAAVSESQWVCQYEGRLVEWEEYSKIHDASDGNLTALDYMFQVVDPEEDGEDDYVFLDARESTHFSRYFNHDERGNLNVTVFPKERRIDFFASRAIEAGEELTFDCMHSATPTLDSDVLLILLK